MNIDNPKTFNVFRDHGTKFFVGVDTVNEAWSAIGELNWGEGYIVRDKDGNVMTEFIPF